MSRTDLVDLRRTWIVGGVAPAFEGRGPAGLRGRCLTVVAAGPVAQVMVGLGAAGDMRELLLAITGWVAAMESRRRSERTRAGMERARREGTRSGKPIGRPAGSKDGRRRKRSGYVARWERPEERERARARAQANKGMPAAEGSPNSTPGPPEAA